MHVSKKLRVAPDAKFRLSQCPADATPACHAKAKAVEALDDIQADLWRLQYRLYAENRRAVLVILQGMDGAGKDGVIRHVLSGLNPQGCRVTSFKVPSAAERAHDFLWRIHQAVPQAGEIGVFNRSHYEDVLVTRVRQLVPPAVWQARFDQINAFERHLTDNGVVIVKFFLHLSRAEQFKRLLARLDDPDRNWKLSQADIKERAYWDAYHAAYEDVLRRCSTPYAPWYVIPADHKWYRNWAVSEILRGTLKAMEPQVPPPLDDVKALRRRLIASARGHGQKNHQ